MAIPIHESDLRQQAIRLKSSIERFHAIDEERQRGFLIGSEVGIGSELDDEYDRVFDELMATAEDLETALEARLIHQQERSQVIFLTIVAVWSLIIVAAAGGLWTRERHLRRAEEALRRSHEQLTQSQRLEAMGRVAGGLAHDINNYLAAIRGHCEIVRMKRPDDERIARKMDSAIRTVHKASALLDRLLAFSRQQPVKLEVINLNRVIEGMEKMIRSSLGTEIRVEARLAEDLWSVEVDLVQTEQILINLLVNARDAMSQGGEVVIETGNVRVPSVAGRSHPGDMGAAVDLRHRLRHSPRRTRQDLRAVLDDQGRGFRRRPRPRHRLWHRPSERRDDRRGERGRPRHDLRDPAAAQHQIGVGDPPTPVERRHPRRQ